MNKSKGIELPISIIVVIGIAVLVLVSVSVFLFSSGGLQISKAEAERIYREGCSRYCNNLDSRANYNTAMTLETTDKEFMEACKVKGIDLAYSAQDVPISIRCIQACPCDVSITPYEESADRNAVGDRILNGDPMRGIY